jgi:maltose alpha-D-glucosyltransferase/alpha-amylase
MRDALVAHVERYGASALAALPAGRWQKTRYHGDYHLGQVLLVRDDFLIADFEGEPGRPLSERRRKHSALRDVAGMLRSFAYAREAALRHALEVPENVERLPPFARAWELEARRAFLEAYAKGAQAAGLYASFDAARELVALFELEKSLYELRYELANRPAWAGIALGSLLALAGPA